MTMLREDVSETTQPARNGWRKHVTIQNALLLVVALFQAGSYYERLQNTNASLLSRVEAAEQSIERMRQATDATYVRKDVMESWMKAVNDSLADIKAALRGGGR